MRCWICAAQQFRRHVNRRTKKMEFFKKLRFWKRAGRNTGVKRGLLKCLLPCIWRRARSTSAESIRSTQENTSIIQENSAESIRSTQENTNIIQENSAESIRSTQENTSIIQENLQEGPHRWTGAKFEALIEAERQKELLCILQMTGQEMLPNVSRHIAQDYGISIAETEEGHQRKERGLCLEDFNIIGLLGKGAFGKVVLAKHKSTGGLSSSEELFAIKVVPNRYVFEAEKEVFIRALGHPFLIQLHTYFQTEESFYYVMEYLEAGTLAGLIIRNEQLSEDVAQFYAAEIILAVQFLHNCGIIHRDIKPVNILLDKDGHCKLADFGVAKLGLFKGLKMRLVCGTAGYMAPEICQGRPYGPEVDWYSVGCVMCDMLLGCFDLDNRLDPSYLTLDAASIIEMFLNEDPELRLGAHGDMRSILMHPFFKGVNWGAILQKRVTPPYKPRAVNVQPLKCPTVDQGSSSDVHETGNDNSLKIATKGPALEEPALEGPVLEEPALEGPALEEPALEGPVLEGPVLEEPVMEGPALQGPAHTTECLLHLLGGPFLRNRNLLLFRGGIPLPHIY